VTDHPASLEKEKEIAATLYCIAVYRDLGPLDLLAGLGISGIAIALA
jgi:hypothetical protein